MTRSKGLALERLILVEMILAEIGKLFKISVLTNSSCGVDQACGGIDEGACSLVALVLKQLTMKRKQMVFL